MTVTVIGADGRRIVRNVDRQYAADLAARIHAQTGETIEIVDEELEASGIRQRPFAGVDPAATEAASDSDGDEPDEAADTAPKPKPRRRRSA